MPVEPDYASVLTSPTQETLPPYSPGWRQDGDVDEKEEEELAPKSRSPWKWWHQWAVAYGDAPHVFNVAFDKFWNSNSKKLALKEQAIALLLLTVFGVIPLALLGHFSRRGSNYYYGAAPFASIFEDKIMGCGTSFGTPKNATVKGVEKLFVLDQTYGRFTFAQVKTLDVFWDIAIGRGVQMIAWWVGYIVFSDALLRAIERHPASFRIFQRIALEGPSVLSLITLVKELWRARSMRTRALFFYIWLATLYIISIPMFLSAMTGYDTTSTPWVSLDDDNNIVPASTMKSAWIVSGTWNETFGQDEVCLDIGDYFKIGQETTIRERYCDCQLRNGTIVNASRYSSAMPYYTYYSSLRSECRFDFPGSNKTFKDNSYGYYADPEVERKCNSTFDVTINGKKYDAANLNGTSGYCYDGNGYSYSYLYDRSRCLPDTTDPTYQWGFSSMLSGLFIIFNFTWVISMYIVWQDAQINSTLIGTGYQMTPLRAAFAMAKAAKRKTGLGEKQLVRANTKELEQELYGSKGMKATEVEFGIFEEDEEHGEVEIRRRISRPRDEDEVEEREKDKEKRRSVEVEVERRRSGEMSDVPLNP